MSLIQSVRVKLRCRKCGKVHETTVQFQSELNHDAIYELMEVVPRHDRLAVGEIYEGTGDRYCRECFQQWAASEATAGYESLAELIEKRIVKVRATGASLPLSASAVIEYGKRYVSELADCEAYPVGGPFFEEFDIVIGKEPVGVGSENWIEFLDLIDPLIRRRMKKGPWKGDSASWLEDFRVYLDDERRILVEDTDGKRLMPDGARAE